MVVTFIGVDDRTMAIFDFHTFLSSPRTRTEIGAQSTNVSEKLVPSWLETHSSTWSPVVGARRLPIFLFLITVVGALPVLWNGFVDWRDGLGFVENIGYRGFDRIHLLWMFTSHHGGVYQPLTWLTFAMDYTLWDLDPFGVHLTSLLVHGANAVLLWLVLNQVFSSDSSYSSNARPELWQCATALAVLSFSLHPLRVEPVAWASVRGVLLSTFFLLAAVYSYLRCVKYGSGTRYWMWMVLTLCGQLFCILAGSNGLSVAVLLVLLDVYPLWRYQPSEGHWSWLGATKIWFEKVPFFALVAVPIFTAETPTAQPLAGYGADVTQLEWIAQRLYAPIFFLWKTIIPALLAPVYDPPDARGVYRWAFLVGGVGLLAIGVGAWRVRSRLIPPLVTALCYLTLVFTPIFYSGAEDTQVLADRYAYLPSLVLAAIVAASLVRVFHAWQRDGIRPFVLATSLAITGAFLFVLSILSWQQAGVWHSAEKLWKHSVAIQPESRLAREKLGQLLSSQRKEAEVLELFEDAARSYPASALVHADLARAFASRGEIHQAEISYQRALEIDPYLRQARLGMGNILVSRADFSGALEQYRVALSRGPTASVHINMGYSLARVGKLNEAIRQYRAALELDATNVNAYFNLANALAADGRTKEAIENYQQVLKLRPNHSRGHFALADVLLQAGRSEDAMDHYQQAINYDPEFTAAYLRVGTLLAEQGQYENAIAYYRHALGLRPNFGEARLNLARALVAMGRKQEALREYEEAKRLLQAGETSTGARAQ
jgi:tetratricopeptide (TPR) repeat protein